MKDAYTPVMGLEIHVELATQSKMFCGCPADWFGKEPNTQTCPVCLGLPGALPVPNKKAIEWCILIGKALGCKTNRISKFDRKNYFYPDLSKAYQISQYDLPFSYEGEYEFTSNVTGKPKKVGITRVHMEEDTGKLSHEGTDSLVDFNRSGVPLVEIVTDPDFDNAEDVKQFLEELQVVIRYLGVSDADMEKGSMRLEPNISVRLPGQTELPNYKVEVKNINSFRYAKLAIEYEVKRHIQLLEKQETPVQETRGFDDKKNVTVSQRRKEEASDYRYFPDPDIPPFELSEEYVAEIASQIPELPHVKLKKYQDQYGIRQADAYIITRDPVLARHFDEILEKASATQGVDMKTSPQKWASYIVNKKISADLKPEEFIKKALDMSAPRETDASHLKAVIQKAIQDNPDVVEQYKSGKASSINVLVGSVLREMKGQADPQLVRAELEKEL